MDLVPLANHFIESFCLKYQKDFCQLTKSAQRAIVEYHWPGNVREMSHLIERAVLLSPNNAIDAEDLRLTAAAPLTDLPLYDFGRRRNIPDQESNETNR